MNPTGGYTSMVNKGAYSEKRKYTRQDKCMVYSFGKTIVERGERERLRASYTRSQAAELVC